ncbi:MAG: 3-deoxy-D-manno-octulosonic acid transferase, partial [Bacteroidota bacterium]
KLFKDNSPVLVVGSSWPPDIELIANFYNDFPEKLKLIIAPHEIGEGKLEKTVDAFPKKKIIKFSEGEHKNPANYDILLIDNIGMLSSLYHYGEYAYIGGAFGAGLHNTLEAATYGVPVFFGKKYNKFNEAVDLINLKGAFSVKDAEAFESIFLTMYNDKTLRNKTGKICSDYVMGHIGGTQKVIAYCKEKLIDAAAR